MSGDKYLISDKASCYFVFSRKEYKDIIVDSLNYCIAEKGLVVYAWVIISNHIHLVITTKLDAGNISDIIRDFKKHKSFFMVGVPRLTENSQLLIITKR